MAREALTVQEISLIGLTPSYTAAVGDGHKFVNNGDVLIHVKNGDASSMDVTIQTPAKVQGVDVAEISVTVGASDEEMIGPFPPALFNNSDGVYVDYSSITSVTVAAIKLG